MAINEKTCGTCVYHRDNNEAIGFVGLSGESYYLCMYNVPGFDGEINGNIMFHIGVSGILTTSASSCGHYINRHNDVGRVPGVTGYSLSDMLRGGLQEMLDQRLPESAAEALHGKQQVSWQCI